MVRVWLPAELNGKMTAEGIGVTGHGETKLVLSSLPPSTQKGLLQAAAGEGGSVVNSLTSLEPHERQ